MLWVTMASNWEKKYDWVVWTDECPHELDRTQYDLDHFAPYHPDREVSASMHRKPIARKIVDRNGDRIILKPGESRQVLKIVLGEPK